MIKTVVKVDGMMCGMCESHMNDMVRRAFDIKKVTSSHSKGETVIISELPITAAGIKAAVEGSGYEIGDVISEPYEEKKGLFSFFKKK